MKKYRKWFDWHEAVNKTVNESLLKCYPRDWKDEDHLTRNLLAALRDEHSSVTIEKDKVSGKNIKCCWDVYKNTMEMGMEQKHGDIGVLVQLIFDSSKVLEGVAFLEAKRIYHNSSDESKSCFAALDEDQLKRYGSNSSFHRTVFYDCQEKSGTHQASSFTLPTSHLLVLNKNDRNVYPYCEYFSYCLTNRYFQGYELDFDEESVDAVKGFLGANGGVRYLIVAQTILGPDISPNTNINLVDNAIYSRLELDGLDDSPKANFSGPKI
ncbi:hypothetical protein [Oryzomicrobium sp.]|uniref:hypothetical protein n=1 Tax=Oryzomicrobium sp. TaxID=1911578 RepID=UPI002FDF3478